LDLESGKAVRRKTIINRPLTYMEADFSWLMKKKNKGAVREVKSAWKKDQGMVLASRN
jgi:hypothetical protein